MTITAAAAAATAARNLVLTDDAHDLSRKDNKKKGSSDEEEEEENRRKIHISRVPSGMAEMDVQQLFVEALLLSSAADNPVERVSLVYPQKQQGSAPDETNFSFGFVTMASVELQQKALALKRLSVTTTGSDDERGPKHKKQDNKILIRPYHQNIQAGICFKWSQVRCPYGDKCQFRHEGAGGCIELPSTVPGRSNVLQNNKRKRCNAFKKGKCKLGEENCPFSHDFDPATILLIPKSHDTEIPKSSKDCITWKTKGKCKRNEKGTCPYRHEPGILKSLELKKKLQQHKNRKLEDHNATEEPTTARKKEKHPLWVRVFGLSYDTTEAQVRDFFQSCGTLIQVEFPVWEDSGRSKGYCGVQFPSPKAVEKAVALDGSELHGRWLRIQVGKMYLKQWQEREEEQRKQQQICAAASKCGNPSAINETRSKAFTDNNEVGNSSRRSAKRKRRQDHDK